MLLFVVNLCIIIVAYGQKTCNVLDYGAKGDGKTDDTKAIQDAIDSCSQDPEHPNTITFPSNYNFLSFPFRIKTSNTILYIAQNSTITATTDYKNWPHDDKDYTDFITNEDGINNLEIKGQGVINGNGQFWWPLYKKGELKYVRPKLITLYKMSNITVHDITMINSPMFHLNIEACQNVIVYGINITVTTPGYDDAPNTDGIDIGSENAHIYNSFVQNGDDSYVLKAGARNVLIENSTCQLGLGLDVGTGGNITNATFRNMYVRETAWGIRLKAKADTQNGIQSDILFTNITFDKVGKAIDINEFNQSVSNNYDNLQWVDIKNIIFEDIKGSYTVYAGHLDCNEGYACTNLTFKDIDLKGDGTNSGWQCSDNIKGTQDNVTPPIPSNCLN